MRQRRIVKYVSLLLVLFVVSTSVNAQSKPRHEVELGVGIWNTNEIINTFSDIIISSLPNDMSMKDANSYGSIHLGYKYRRTERLGIGGLFAYDYSTVKGVLQGNEVGKFKKIHYTVALEMDYIYVNSGKFDLYGLVGLGGVLYNLYYTDHKDPSLDDSDMTPYFAFQLTPVGVRYGDKVGAFMELGFGYRGILNAGVFVRW